VGSVDRQRFMLQPPAPHQPFYASTEPIDVNFYAYCIAAVFRFHPQQALQELIQVRCRARSLALFGFMGCAGVFGAGEEPRYQVSCSEGTGVVGCGGTFLQPRRLKYGTDTSNFVGSEVPLAAEHGVDVLRRYTSASKCIHRESICIVSGLSAEHFRRITGSYRGPSRNNRRRPANCVPCSDL